MGNSWEYSVDRKLKKSLSEFDKDAYYFLINRNFLNQKNYTEEIGEMFSIILSGVFKNSKNYFQDDFFTNPLPEKGEPQEFTSKNGENLLSFIIPALQNVFSRFWINPPSLFTDLQNSSLRSPNVRDQRLEIFQLSFDSNEFLEFLAQKLRKNIDILDDFDNLDHYSKIIEIIIDDYVSSKVKFVQGVDDIKAQIRYLKIKKGLEI
jgi:hypothetical protein